MAKFNIGDTITFRYNKREARDKNPTLLVVSPLFKNHVHGVNLNYLNDAEREYISKDINSSDKITSEIFYEQHVKPRLRSNAYRTYTPRLMSNIKVIK
tara:strand:- start:78 stop:371 length:294 start_codon:yes stop_codon:yes gene_type:complete